MTEDWFGGSVGIRKHRAEFRGKIGQVETYVYCVNSLISWGGRRLEPGGKSLKGAECL